MRTERAIALLNERIKEGEEVLRANLASLDDWKVRTAATLRAVLSADNQLIEQFNDVSYHPSFWTAGTDFRPYRLRGLERALGIVRTAVYELEELADGQETDDAAYDPELWEHVSEVVTYERWETVVSQAVIFLEDRLRKWSGRPETEYGVNLVANVLKADGGDFPLGRTDNEKRGWQNFALGIVGAIGNAARHRIDDRTDAKRYALGVLGSVSLLITELRNAHEASFKNVLDRPS